MQASSGTSRYRIDRVVFSKPFSLGDATEVYPAGTYQVETAEEAFEGHEHTAHVRTSTVLIISTRSGTIHRKVDGTDLEKALAQDAERQEQRSFSENPDRGGAD